jgi:hypothetical protein
VQDGIVELAREPQRPELRALLDHGSRRGGGAAVGPRMVSVALRVLRSISTLTLE